MNIVQKTGISFGNLDNFSASLKLGLVEAQSSAPVVFVNENTIAGAEKKDTVEIKKEKKPAKSAASIAAWAGALIAGTAKGAVVVSDHLTFKKATGSSISNFIKQMPDMTEEAFGELSKQIAEKFPNKKTAEMLSETLETLKKLDISKNAKTVYKIVPFVQIGIYAIAGALAGTILGNIAGNFFKKDKD